MNPRVVYRDFAAALAIRAGNRIVDLLGAFDRFFALLWESERSARQSRRAESLECGDKSPLFLAPTRRRALKGVGPSSTDRSDCVRARLDLMDELQLRGLVEVGSIKVPAQL